MIFIDSNIPMYLIGAPHENKTAATALLGRLIRERNRLVTDAEVFQEILHRHSAIGRRDAIQPAYDVLERLVDETLSIDRAVVEEAKHILLAYHNISARDAVHAAAIQVNAITAIASFDSGFDALPEITRFSH